MLDLMRGWTRRGMPVARKISKTSSAKEEESVLRFIAAVCWFISCSSFFDIRFCKNGVISLAPCSSSSRELTPFLETLALTFFSASLSSLITLLLLSRSFSTTIGLFFFAANAASFSFFDRTATATGFFGSISWSESMLESDGITTCSTTSSSSSSESSTAARRAFFPLSAVARGRETTASSSSSSASLMVASKGGRKSSIACRRLGEEADESARMGIGRWASCCEEESGRRAVRRTEEGSRGSEVAREVRGDEVARCREVTRTGREGSVAPRSSASSAALSMAASASRTLTFFLKYASAPSASSSLSIPPSGEGELGLASFSPLISTSSSSVVGSVCSHRRVGELLPLPSRSVTSSLLKSPSRFSSSGSNSVSGIADVEYRTRAGGGRGKGTDASLEGSGAAGGGLRP